MIHAMILLLCSIPALLCMFAASIILEFFYRRNHIMNYWNSSPKSNPISIKQPNGFVKDIGHLFNNHTFSDLTLIVNETERFAVHKSILFVRCEYFRTLLRSGGVRESTQHEISIQESNAGLFEKLLRYIYTSEIELDKSNSNEMAEMLIMADKYLMLDLKSSLEDQLSSMLSIDNFCSLYSKAAACSARKLKQKCLAMADSNAQSVLEMGGFSGLTAHAIEGIIGRASFKPPQSSLFTALDRWIKTNGNKDPGALLSKIRLTDMPMNFLLTTVRQSGLFSEHRILDAAASVSAKSDSSKIKDTLSATKGNGRLLIKLNPIYGKSCKRSIYLDNPRQTDSIRRIRDSIKASLPGRMIWHRLGDLYCNINPRIGATFGECGILDEEKSPMLLIDAHGLDENETFFVTFSVEQRSV